MALERRNALARQLLSVIGEDRAQHLQIGRGLHALDFEPEPTTRRSRGIGFADAPSMIGKLVPALLTPILALIGSAIAGYIGAQLMGIGDDPDPTDPEKKKLTFKERAKKLVGGDVGVQAAPLEERKLAPSMGVTSDMSPLLPQGVEIPSVKTSTATAAQKYAIKAGSAKSGVDYSLMYAVAGAESSFQNNVSAGTSSAQGLYQFTNSTWTYMCDELGLKYTLEDRNDPEKASHVAGMYVARIIRTLSKVLGRKPSYGETYLGYFLGPTGGAKFLQAMIQNPNALGSELFPRAADANPGIFYAKGKPLTLGQTLAKLEGKIASYSGQSGEQRTRVAGGDQSITAPTVEQPKTVVGPTKVTFQDQSVGKGTSAMQPMNVTIPTADVTNIRKVEQPRTPAPPTRVAQQAPSSSGSGSGSGSMGNSNAEETTLLRGRDGRLYKIS